MQQEFQNAYQVLMDYQADLEDINKFLLETNRNFRQINTKMDAANIAKSLRKYNQWLEPLEEKMHELQNAMNKIEESSMKVYGGVQLLNHYSSILEPFKESVDMLESDVQHMEEIKQYFEESATEASKNIFHNNPYIDKHGSELRKIIINNDEITQIKLNEVIKQLEKLSLENQKTEEYIDLLCSI